MLVVLAFVERLNAELEVCTRNTTVQAVASGQGCARVHDSVHDLHSERGSGDVSVLLTRRDVQAPCSLVVHRVLDGVLTLMSECSKNRRATSGAARAQFQGRAVNNHRSAVPQVQIARERYAPNKDVSSRRRTADNDGARRRVQVLQHSLNGSRGSVKCNLS